VFTVVPISAASSLNRFTPVVLSVALSCKVSVAHRGLLLVARGFGGVGFMLICTESAELHAGFRALTI